MRKMILAPTLMLALSVSALAEGDMQFGLTSPPTPTPTRHLTSDAGGSHAGCAVTDDEAAILSETLSNLIDSVLALF